MSDSADFRQLFTFLILFLKQKIFEKPKNHWKSITLIH